MHKISLLVLCALLLGLSAVVLADSSASPGKQTVLTSRQPEAAPLVVIYTLSDCPHCHEAKEYFRKNNIPYINREVDMDDEHMEALMKIYDSMGVPQEKRGVPLLVIGERIRLQGFNSEKFQNALKEVSGAK